MMDAGALPSHHDEKIDIRVTSLLAAGDGAVHADRQEVPSLSTSEIRCNRLGECETTGDGHRLGQPLTGLSGFSTSSSKLMIRITDHVTDRIAKGSDQVHPLQPNARPGWPRTSTLRAPGSSDGSRRPRHSTCARPVGRRSG